MITTDTTEKKEAQQERSAALLERGEELAEVAAMSFLTALQLLTKAREEK